MNDIPIIYENEEIFVINKKSGLAVQGGEKIKNSLDNLLEKQTGKKVYLVHRLDKETYGLMIVAKNPVSASKWTKLISSKKVKKEYTALCAGKMKDSSGVIFDSVIQHGKEKSALTYYQVQKEFESEIKNSNDENNENSKKITFSLLKLQIETGRMHQIRIHLAKNGCPIAGDDKHGDFKLNKILKKNFGIKKLMLCSTRLEIPFDKKIMRFEIKDDFIENIEIKCPLC